MSKRGEQALSKLAELQQVIDTHMAAFFIEQSDQIDDHVPDSGREAYRLLEEFSLRPGKRLRGALAMLGYGAFGGKNENVGRNLAIAIELIQNYLLIIDDVMDRSDQRRGAATIHELYKASIKPEKEVDVPHMANMLATNAALIGQHMASQIMAELEESPKRVNKASALFHKNISLTGYGQIEDLYSDSKATIDHECIENIARLKTSYYTFINPLQTAAVLAGADDMLDDIAEFGIPAGIAFQTQDDIIGTFGDSNATGKPNMDDLREGKITLLVEKTLELGDKDQKAAIVSALGNDDIDESMLEATRDAMKQSGAYEYTVQYSIEQADRARAILKANSWPGELDEFLAGVIDFIIGRDK